MAWTNAFALGECTVKIVLRGHGLSDGYVAFSQVMAPGDFATYYDGTDGPYPVEVSQNGVLFAGFPSGEGARYRATLCIVPSYTPPKSARAVYIQAAYQDPGEYAYFQVTDDDYLEFPLDAIPSSVGLAVQGEYVGINLPVYGDYTWIGFAPEYNPSSSDPDTPKNTNYVYEMEKGWSFDGAYIPHFLELNWLFQEDPFTYTSVQKVRVHGLAKGKAQLHVSMAGMQPDPIADYTSDYSEPQWLDLPYTPMHVSSDFVPVTHYVDYSDRGLALQMKFEGRNTDLTKPEPAHVLQVLALQGTPRGNGARSN